MQGSPLNPLEIFATVEPTVVEVPSPWVAYVAPAIVLLAALLAAGTNYVVAVRAGRHAFNARMYERHLDYHVEVLASVERQYVLLSKASMAVQTFIEAQTAAAKEGRPLAESFRHDPALFSDLKESTGEFRLVLAKRFVMAGEPLSERLRAFDEERDRLAAFLNDPRPVDRMPNLLVPLMGVKLAIAVNSAEHHAVLLDGTLYGFGRWRAVREQRREAQRARRGYDAWLLRHADGANPETLG